MSNSFFQQNGIPNFPIQFMTRPSDGDVLTYSTEKGCWINQAGGGGGGSDATAIQGVPVNEGPYNDAGPLAYINSHPPAFAVVSTIAINEIVSNGSIFAVIGLESYTEETAGDITITAGANTDTGNGGAVEIRGGAGAALGGDILIESGLTNSAIPVEGSGDIRILCGDAYSGGAGGSVFIRGGRNTANDDSAGIVFIQSSNAFSDTVMTASTSTAGNAAISFFDGVPREKTSVTGSRGGNAALASLLTALANYGLITNNTTA